MNVNGAGAPASGEINSSASPPMSPTQKMSDLFDAIDTSGSGSITKSQFEQAFQTLNPPPSFQAAGADAVWTKLDPNGTGSVSKNDFVDTMTAQMKQLRGHHHRHHASAAGASSANQSANLFNALGTSGASPTPNSTNRAPANDAVGSILDFLA